MIRNHKQDPNHRNYMIHRNNTKYNCPDVCFDWSTEQKLKNPILFKANEYIDILKTNPMCSTIDVSSLEDNTNNLKIDYNSQRNRFLQ